MWSQGAPRQMLGEGIPFLSCRRRPRQSLISYSYTLSRAWTKTLHQYVKTVISHIRTCISPVRNEACKTEMVSQDNDELFQTWNFCEYFLIFLNNCSFFWDDKVRKNIGSSIMTLTFSTLFTKFTEAKLCFATLAPTEYLRANQTSITDF